MDRPSKPHLAIAGKEDAGTNVRERIIDCATLLLGREGYGAMSVSAICKMAEVSAPTLYWHFGNKEGLLAELLKRSLRQDADAFMSIDISNIPRHEAFELYLAALKKIVVNKRPNNWVILSALSEARHAAPEIVEIIAEARRRQVEYNAEQIRVLWGCRHSQMIVHMWLSYCNYISLLYQDTKSEQLVDEAIDSFRRAYFLVVAALSEEAAADDGFHAPLLAAGYNPLPLPPGNMPRQNRSRKTQPNSQRTER
jgi:AcrR family transcriptional regulator